MPAISLELDLELVAAPSQDHSNAQSWELGSLNATHALLGVSSSWASSIAAVNGGRSDVVIRIGSGSGLGSSAINSSAPPGSDLPCSCRLNASAASHTSSGGVALCRQPMHKIDILECIWNQTASVNRTVARTNGVGFMSSVPLVASHASAGGLSVTDVVGSLAVSASSRLMAQLCLRHNHLGSDPLPPWCACVAPAAPGSIQQMSRCGRVVVLESAIRLGVESVANSTHCEGQARFGRVVMADRVVDDAVIEAMAADASLTLSQAQDLVDPDAIQASQVPHLQARIPASMSNAVSSSSSSSVAGDDSAVVLSAQVASSSTIQLGSWLRGADRVDAVAPWRGAAMASASSSTAKQLAETVTLSNPVSARIRCIREPRDQQEPIADSLLHGLVTCQWVLALTAEDLAGAALLSGFASSLEELNSRPGALEATAHLPGLPSVQSPTARSLSFAVPDNPKCAQLVWALEEPDQDGGSHSPLVRLAVVRRLAMSQLALVQPAAESLAASSSSSAEQIMEGCVQGASGSSLSPSVCQLLEWRSWLMETSGSASSTNRQSSAQGVAHVASGVWASLSSSSMVASPEQFDAVASAAALDSGALSSIDAMAALQIDSLRATAAASSVFSASEQIVLGPSLPPSTVSVQLTVAPAESEVVTVACNPSVMGMVRTEMLHSGWSQSFPSPPPAAADADAESEPVGSQLANGGSTMSFTRAQYNAILSAASAVSLHLSIEYTGSSSGRAFGSSSPFLPIETMSIVCTVASSSPAQSGEAVYSDVSPSAIEVRIAPVVAPLLGDAMSAVNATAVIGTLAQASPARLDAGLAFHSFPEALPSSDSSSALLAAMASQTAWSRATDRGPGMLDHLGRSLQRSNPMPLSQISNLTDAVDQVASLLVSRPSGIAELLGSSIDTLAAMSAATRHPSTSIPEPIRQDWAALLPGSMSSLPSSSSASASRADAALRTLLSSPMNLVVAQSGQTMALLCSGAISVAVGGGNATSAPGASCVGVGTRVFLGGGEASVTHVLAGGIGVLVTLPPSRCACGGNWSTSNLNRRWLPPGAALFRVSSACSEALAATSLTVINPIVMDPPPEHTVHIASSSHDDDDDKTASTSSSSHFLPCEAFALSQAHLPDTGWTAGGFAVGCDLPALLVSHRAAAPHLRPGQRLGGCVSGVLDAEADRQGEEGTMRFIPQGAAAASVVAEAILNSSADLGVGIDLVSAAMSAPVGASYTSRCVGFPPPGALCKDMEAVSAGLVCAYGQGAECTACPSGALCPGGYVALPVAGWWNEPSVLLESLVRCEEPSTARCVGWSDVSGSSECGVGFQGYACSECSEGYFPDEIDGCLLCPQGQQLELLLRPFVTYLLAIVAMLAGVGLFFLVVSRVRQVKTSRMVRSFTQFAVWALILLQTIAQIGSSSPTNLVPELGRLYGWLAVFELDPGVSVHSACLGTLPLANEMIILALVTVVACSLLASMVCLRRSLFRLHPEAAASSLVDGKRPASLRPVTRCGKLIGLMFTLLSVLFALSIKTSLSLLQCVPDQLQRPGSTRYVLASNRFAECYVTPHAELSIVAGVLLALLPVTLVVYAVMAHMTAAREARLARDGDDPGYGTAWWSRCVPCCCGWCRASEASHSLPSAVSGSKRSTTGPMVMTESPLRVVGSSNPIMMMMKQQPRHLSSNSKSSSSSSSSPTGQSGSPGTSQTVMLPSSVSVPTTAHHHHDADSTTTTTTISAAAGAVIIPGARKDSSAPVEGTWTSLAPTLSVRLSRLPETLPLLNAEYKPKEAAIFRLLDLGLILLLALSNVVMDADAAAARVVSRDPTVAGGIRSSQALAAVVGARWAQMAITGAACLAMIVLLLFTSSGGPYLTVDAWKRPVRVTSLCLVGAAAALNAVAANADAEAQQSSSQSTVLVQVMSWAVFGLIVLTVASLLVGFLYTTLVASARSTRVPLMQSPRIAESRSGLGGPVIPAALTTKALAMKLQSSRSKPAAAAVSQRRMLPAGVLQSKIRMDTASSRMLQSRAASTASRHRQSRQSVVLARQATVSTSRVKASNAATT